jgi:plasmid replication initiation protein
MSRGKNEGDSIEVSLGSEVEARKISPEALNDLSIKKHRSIIHRTHFTTAVEEKIFNGFLLAAKVAFKTKDYNNFLKDGFHTSEKYIMNFSGIKSKNREFVLEKIDSLQKCVIKFDYFDEDDKFKELRSFTPITEVRILEDGTMRFFLPPTLIELLANPESFTSIDTRITSRFTCVYAIALYELGMSHLDGSFVFTSLPDFRKYMGLKPAEYPNSNDLRRYVIAKGSDEVNLKSDLNVTYTLIKEGWGNKITGVKFDFILAPEPIEIPSDLKQLELVAKFCSILPFSLSGETFVISILKKKLDEFGEEWVESNVEAFLARLNAPGQPPVNKPGALFRTTFKHDYGNDIRNTKKVSAIMARLEKQRALEFNDSETEKNRSAEDQTRHEIDEILAKEEKYIAYYESMGIEEQKNVLAGLEKIPGLFGTKSFKITYYLSEVLAIAF